MSRHEGVSCDSCLKGNFRGRRYKCLVCYDYDLCDTCYETGATNTRHTTDHPVQCILTRADFELFYAGENITNVDQPQAYTCPYCARMGFTDATLQEHVTAEHSDTSYEVVCPVCAAMPGGDPNFMTDDFAGHLTLEHRNATRDLISMLDEPSSSGHNSAAGASTTNRHGGRRVIHLPGRGGQSSRPRRSNMHFSIFSANGLSSLSPSSRESVDPIAELLSQLSGVRRSAGGSGGGSTSGTSGASNTSSQLQQLQMHLQLERQQFNTARQQLERMPRRPNQSQTTCLRDVAAAASSAAAATSSTTASSAAGNANFSYSLMMNANANNVQPAASAPPVPSSPSNFLLEGLLEELSLQTANDQQAADRYTFATNLLVGTMQATSASPQPMRNVVNLSQDVSTVISGSTQQQQQRPTTSQSQARVLRGRARSEGLSNAMRRSEGNRGAAANVPEQVKKAAAPSNHGGSNNSNGNGVSKTNVSR